MTILMKYNERWIWSCDGCWSLSLSLRIPSSLVIYSIINIYFFTTRYTSFEHPFGSAINIIHITTIHIYDSQMTEWLNSPAITFENYSRAFDMQSSSRRTVSNEVIIHSYNFLFKRELFIMIIKCKFSLSNCRWPFLPSNACRLYSNVQFHIQNEISIMPGEGDLKSQPDETFLSQSLSDFIISVF